MSVLISQRLILLLTIIFGFISCTGIDPDFDAERDIRNGNVHLISYGTEMLFDTNDLTIKRQIDHLQSAYGFYTENRGCGDIPERMLKAEQYNKMMILYLARRNGKNWHERYRKQEDSLWERKRLERHSN